jgi:hypothetical protein
MTVPFPARVDEAMFTTVEAWTVTGRRDRASIGVTVNTFARVNAVIGSSDLDFFTWIQNFRDEIRPLKTKTFFVA